MLAPVKRLLRKFVFPEGSIRTVLWGPCRGLRYRIFPGYGWAFIYGGWEREVVQVIRRQVRPGSVVYDLGANYGMHTLLFSRLVGPSGRVYSFEPHPSICAALEEQLTINSIQNVTTVRRAVSSQAGKAFFDVAHHRGAGHLATAGTMEVETITLDQFTAQPGVAPPGFIKIDIEGAESMALQGGLKTLERHRPRILVELHNPTEDRAVGRILLDLKYSAFRVEHGGSQVKDMTSGWPDPNGMSGMVLCLPDELPH